MIPALLWVPWADWFNPWQYIDNAALLRPNHVAAWTMSAYESSRQAAIAETLDHILALEIVPANLTDAEWDLVADLFERAPGQRGTPAHY